MNATFQPCIVNFILQADSRYLTNSVFSFGTCSKLLRHSKKVVRNKKIAKLGHGSDLPFVCNNKNHWKGENYDLHEMMNVFLAIYLLLDPKLACLYVFANNIIFFFPKSNQKGGMQIKSHSLDTAVGLANHEWGTFCNGKTCTFNANLRLFQSWNRWRDRV